MKPEIEVATLSGQIDTIDFQTAKNGNEYATIKVLEPVIAGELHTKAIWAKWWESKPAHEFKRGDTVTGYMEVGEYNGKPNYTIKSLMKSQMNLEHVRDQLMEPIQESNMEAYTKPKPASQVNPALSGMISNQVWEALLSDPSTSPSIIRVALHGLDLDKTEVEGNWTRLYDFLWEVNQKKRKSLEYQQKSQE